MSKRINTSASEINNKRPRGDEPPIVVPKILNSSTRNFDNFNLKKYQKRVKASFNITNYNKNIGSIGSALDDFYEGLMHPIVKNSRKHLSSDLYAVAIESELLVHKPFFITYKRIDAFDKTEFTEMAKLVTQSNEEFILKEIDFTIYVAKEPSGSGKHIDSSKRRAPIEISLNSKKMKCVVTINNKGKGDHSCGYRAIYVGSNYFSQGFDKEVISSKNPRRSKWMKITANGYPDSHQFNATKLFVSNANKYLHNKLCNDKENCLQNCENSITFDITKPFAYHNYDNMNMYLNAINQHLVVINASDLKNPVYQEKTAINNSTPLYIEWQSKERHYNFIKSMESYIKTDYFCHSCLKGHYQINHQCENICAVCFSSTKCEGGDKVDCETCGITFVNKQCFDNHNDTNPKNRFRKCKNSKRCNECRCIYRVEKGTTHICGRYKCKDCRETYSESPHYCMLKPVNTKTLAKEDEENKIIVNFDIESMIITDGSRNSKHEPNLLVSETTCDNCWDKELEEKPDDCSTCGKLENIFEEEGCVKSFCDYLYNDLAKKAEKHKIKITVFAHNAKGYDGHFIMQDIFERNFADPPEFIMQGLKVLKIGINNILFIDSLNFFQQPLSALPKSFGFQHVVEKGFFPHLFNKQENQDYVGKIPDKEYFGIENMKESCAKECEEWHKNYEGVYNFKEELVKYCKNDVKILTRAVMKFRELFKSVTGLDPITRNFTLASVAMEHFRSLLKPDQIGITPIKGYMNNRSKSIKANIWLDWHQNEFKRNILREHKIGPYYTDGYHKESKTIYEFFGCYFHGCDKSKCNKNKDRNEVIKKLNYRSPNQALKDTHGRNLYFKEKGYKLIYIWEHEYEELIRKDYNFIKYISHRSQYYDTLKVNGHINIRDSFFGGSTNNLFFSHTIENGEKIRYLDVTSLYPSVLVKNPYPIGHPKILNEFTKNEITKYYGFIKCKVLPPKDLYIPVLPYRDSKNKLLFPLCHSCAEEKSNNFCTHPDKKRCLIGTWFSEELKLAVSKGYKIIDLYEVLHYEQKSEDIFKRYIQSWLKIKTESSGWPSSCKTDVEKHKFIQDFNRKEGIELNPTKIIKNHGLRYIAKLMLNSLWGKFGQRQNRGKTIICNNSSQFYELISDAKYKINGMVTINDQTILVNYEFVDDGYDKAGNTSTAIASMVTSYARIKLYSIIDGIESSHRGRVLYFDTDSVIFKDNSSLNWYVPEIGDFLGDMTDEIEKDHGPESYIDKFASGGPKNYAYTVKTPTCIEIKTKIKGINITSGIKDKLDFNCVNEFAKEYRNGQQLVKEVQQLQFRSDQTHNVYTSLFPKQYRTVSDKRMVIKTGPIHTVPYGYTSNDLY